MTIFRYDWRIRDGEMGPMQFMEAAKKAGLFGKHYAAIVSVVLTDEAQLSADLSDLKAQMLDWRASRGRSAKDVMITLVGHSSANEWSKNMVRGAFETDADLSRLASNCRIQVSILNKGNAAADQFVVGG